MTRLYTNDTSSSYMPRTPDQKEGTQTEQVVTTQRSFTDRRTGRKHTRRAVLKFITAGGLGAILAACSSPDTTPLPATSTAPTTRIPDATLFQNPVDTATAVKTSTSQATSVPSATVRSSATAEPSPTSTLRPPPTETPKPTQQPTLVPTPTEKLRSVSVVFKDNGSLTFGHGSEKMWNNPHESGGILEIIDDPTNSGRGKVLKCTIKGPPVSLPNYGSGYWRAIYPDWTNGYPARTVPAHCGISCDVYLSTPFKNIGLLGVHRLNKQTLDRISVAGFEYYGGNNLVLVARDGQGNDKRVNLQSNFKRNSWNTLAIEIQSDGTVIPIINGINSYQSGDMLMVPVDAQHDAGFVDGHAGIILSNNVPSDNLSDGDYVLNKDFTVYRRV